MKKTYFKKVKIVKVQPELSIENAFQSIETMWLHNYDMYRKTLDLNWFIDGYDGRQKKLAPELLAPIEEKINQEYEIKANDPSMRIRIEKTAKVKFLTLKFDTITALVSRIAGGFGASMEEQEMRLRYLTAMKKWGYPMQIMATPHEDLLRLEEINNQKNAIKTQINIILDSLKSDGKKESLSLHKQLMIVGIALQVGYKLDAKKITIAEWLEYGELMEERAKKN